MPDTSKPEKLTRKLEKSEKKLRKAINDEKVLQHQLKQLTRKERTHRLCTRGGMLESFLQEPERICLHIHSANAVAADRMLASASYPFVDLPSGDTLRCKLFPDAKFHEICYLFNRQ